MAPRRRRPAGVEPDVEAVGGGAEAARRALDVDGIAQRAEGAAEEGDRAGKIGDVQLEVIDQGKRSEGSSNDRSARLPPVRMVATWSVRWWAWMAATPRAPDGSVTMQVW